MSSNLLRRIIFWVILFITMLLQQLYFAEKEATAGLILYWAAASGLITLFVEWIEKRRAHWRQGKAQQNC